MDFDPYQAPEASIRPEDRRVDVRKARAMVRPPAIALLVLASIAMLLDLGVMANSLIVDAPRQMRVGGAARGSGFVVGTLLANGGLCCIHGMIWLGSRRMMKVRSYALGLTAAILAMLPFCSPIVIFGIPFGVWAVVALCRSGVADAFRRNDFAPEADFDDIEFLD